MEAHKVGAQCVKSRRLYFLFKGALPCGCWNMLLSFPGVNRFFNVFHRIRCFLLAKPLDHMEDPARGARNNLHTRFKGVDVIGHALATNADMHLDIQVVTLVTVLRRNMTNIDQP